MKQRTLYIVRGLPGSGKTSLARDICGDGFVFSADDFFYELGKGSYAFDHTKLGEAHASCQESVEQAMGERALKIAVANTFTQSWEAEPYFKLADTHGYSVFMVECQSDFGNIHDVPEEAVTRMASRWEPKLRRPE